MQAINSSLSGAHPLLPHPVLCAAAFQHERRIRMYDVHQVLTLLGAYWCTVVPAQTLLVFCCGTRCMAPPPCGCCVLLQTPHRSSAMLIAALRAPGIHPPQGFKLVQDVEAFPLLSITA